MPIPSEHDDDDEADDDLPGVAWHTAHARERAFAASGLKASDLNETDREAALRKWVYAGEHSHAGTSAAEVAQAARASWDTSDKASVEAMNAMHGDILTLVVLYAKEADAYEAEGYMELAWHHASMASYYGGVLAGITEGVFGRDRHHRAQASKQMIDGRHAENRDSRATAMAWYDEHRHECGSDDEAAEKLMKVVPMKFRTIRDWITEHKKPKKSSPFAP